MVPFLAKLIVGSLVCFTAVASGDTAYNTQHYRASLRHIEAGGIGYKHGYTTLDGFFAPDPARCAPMPFLDIRGHVFDNGKLAANVGIGFRKIAGSRIYGLNAYYDYRNTKRAHYNQVGVGLETLGERWDFRINGYFPIEQKITALCPAQFNRFSGNQMIVSQKYQFAMTGTLGELGCHFGKFRIFDFYATAGAYYFKGKIGPNVGGGKVRLIGKFTDYVTVELSNSYDNMFHNRFQCQLTLSVPFGGESQGEMCDASDALLSRMAQPVERQEIVVVGKNTRCTPAINPATGKPYYFVFVDNTSHSFGTYESPYPTFALAQENSKIGDIIYVFPGDGTTRGMNSGIALQFNQKFWGSGVQHPLQTTQGTVTVPVQSSSAPTITNTNIDTEGNAVTLASVNEVSGFVITDASANAIIGADVKSIEVSDCTILNSTVDAMLIESGSSGMACRVTDCNIHDNIGGGCILTFDGPSTLVASGNTFANNTSISSPQIVITAGTSLLAATITNNAIHDNTCGAIRITLNDTDAAQLTIVGNAIANNDSGSQGPLGAPILITPNNTAVGNCRLDLIDNFISGNRGGGALYYANGGFNNLEVNAVGNRVTDNNSSGFTFGVNANTLRLNATNNTIENGADNGIAFPDSMFGIFTTADITIADNQITGNTGGGNGIALSQSGIDLNLVVTNNDISDNDSSGILMYSGSGVENVTVNIAHNTINNNQNVASNQVGGIDLEQFFNLTGSITNNTLFNNVNAGLYAGSTEGTPYVCLNINGNNSDTGYILNNDAGGSFNVAPCDAAAANTGPLNTSGPITLVQSCPAAGACPP